MKIFIDTASLHEIKKASAWGILDGITTNPTLIKKAVDEEKLNKKNVNLEEYIEQLVSAVRGPVSLEVIGTKEDEIFNQAVKLYERFNRIAGNVVIKIPINPSMQDRPDYSGIRATARLAKRNIPVNSTLIMSPEQALFAAKAGAAYVSPFAGRIDDYLREKIRMQFKKADYYPAQGMIFKGELVHDKGIVSGVDLVQKIVDIFRQHNIKTQVIAASIRNAQQAREIAMTGAHIATIPFHVLEEMLCHPKTAEGMAKFSADIVPEYRKLF